MLDEIPTKHDMLAWPAGRAPTVDRTRSSKSPAGARLMPAKYALKPQLRKLFANE
jgi:hypothetical protein